MLEIFFIWLLGSHATEKGRTFWWGLLGPALAYATLGLPTSIFFAVGGSLGGFAGAFGVVSKLPPAAGYELDVPECPSCGSFQTERIGAQVQCFGCNALT